MTLIAKSNPRYPLVDHLRDVGGTTEMILERNGADKKLQQAGKIAGLFHDLGKANPEWQQRAKNSQPLPRHSKLSAILTSGILGYPSIQLPDEHKFGIILAVLHHHTQWTNDNMASTKMGVKKISNTIQNLQSISNSNSSGNTIPKFNSIYSNTNPKELENKCSWVRNKKIENSKAMSIGLRIYSALRQADWHESSRVTGNGTISPIPDTINTDTFLEYNSLRPFQQQVSEAGSPKELIGLAGCGEGKTYSSILWGKEQAQKNNISRLIYAMPTQVTTNNLYTKLSNLTKNNDVSLYHSSAQIYKESEESNSSNSKEDETPSEEVDVSRSELYQAPINVTTVDHLLDTFLSNYDRSGISLGNVLNAGIVFDEIQAYDEKTVGNIIGCIQRCDELGIPYYVMSATIPKQIRTHIPNTAKITSGGSIGHSNTSRKPYSVTVAEEELTANSVTQRISKTDSKVMVVKNTVREAQEVARELKSHDEYDVYYFSSEFPQAHRKEKESEVIDKFEVGQNPEKTRILVCTQICEISLDLSADKLLSDIAPIDSIFQRAGRVHRAGQNTTSSECNCDDCEQKQSEHTYETIVYDTTTQSDAVYPYAEDTETKEFRLLQNTATELSSFGTYTFKKSIDSTDSVYKKYNFEFPEIDRFKASSSDTSRYLENRKSRYEIRSIQSNKISVLPCVFYKEGSGQTPLNLICDRYNVDSKHELTETQIYSFIEEYSIPVPSYWFHSDQYQTSIQDSLSTVVQSPISELKYSYETGVAPPKKSDDSDSSDQPTI